MFAILFVISTFILFAFAAPSGSAKNTCINGSQVQCCNQLQSANSESALALLTGLANIPVINPTSQIGADCTAVGVLGAAGGATCNSQQVCCDQDNVNNGIQILSFNCSPVNFGL